MQDGSGINGSEDKIMTNVVGGIAIVERLDVLVVASLSADAAGKNPKSAESRVLKA